MPDVDVTHSRIEPTSTDLSKALAEESSDLLSKPFPKQLSLAGNEPSDQIGALKQMGFPQVDITGFQQEGLHEDAGILGNLVYGIKSVVGANPSLDDNVRTKVESHMNPTERKQFQQENQAEQDYQNRLLGWEARQELDGGAPPVPPDMPIHRQINNRVTATEHNIDNSVLNSMSPQDRKRLSAELTTYEKENQDRCRLIERGIAVGAPPVPGNAVKDYWDRVKEQTGRFAKS